MRPSCVTLTVWQRWLSKKRTCAAVKGPIALLSRSGKGGYQRKDLRSSKRTCAAVKGPIALLSRSGKGGYQRKELRSGKLQALNDDRQLASNYAPNTRANDCDMYYSKLHHVTLKQRCLAAPSNGGSTFGEYNGIHSNNTLENFPLYGSFRHNR